MGKLTTYLGAGAITLATLFGPTACTQPTNPTGNEIPNNNDGFEKFNSKWTQDQVNAKGKAMLKEMYKQCSELEFQYMTWEGEVRRAMNGNNGALSGNQIGFAQYVQLEEGRLYLAYGRRDIIEARNNSQELINNFAEVVARISTGLVSNPTKETLCKTQIKAFQTANYMNMRAYATPEETAAKQAELNRLIAQIKTLGGGTIPADDLVETIAALKDGLEINMTDKYIGPGKDKLIKQFKQHAQFEGWADDLEKLGYDTYLWQ